MKNEQPAPTDSAISTPQQMPQQLHHSHLILNNNSIISLLMYLFVGFSLRKFLLVRMRSIVSSQRYLLE